METIAFTDARNHLARLIAKIIKNRAPITITRNGEGVVVLLAIDEFEAIEETLHLLSTPANAARIRQGLADYAKGKARARKLCD